MTDAAWIGILQRKLQELGEDAAEAASNLARARELGEAARQLAEQARAALAARAAARKVRLILLLDITCAQRCSCLIRKQALNCGRCLAKVKLCVPITCLV